MLLLCFRDNWTLVRRQLSNTPPGNSGWGLNSSISLCTYTALICEKKTEQVCFTSNWLKGRSRNPFLPARCRSARSRRPPRRSERPHAEPAGPPAPLSMVLPPQRRSRTRCTRGLRGFLCPASPQVTFGRRTWSRLLPHHSVLMKRELAVLVSP